MFEASVQVILAAEHYDVREVRIVDVCVDSEESFKDNFNNLCKIFRKANA